MFALHVQILFAVIFSVARMGFGPYLTYVTVTADNPILIKVSQSTILYPLSLSDQFSPNLSLLHRNLNCIPNSHLPFSACMVLVQLYIYTNLMFFILFFFFFNKAMATGLQLVSAYWFLRILRMVRHKLGKKRPAPKVAGD